MARSMWHVPLARPLFTHHTCGSHAFNFENLCVCSNLRARLINRFAFILFHSALNVMPYPLVANFTRATQETNCKASHGITCCTGIVCERRKTNTDWVSISFPLDLALFTFLMLPRSGLFHWLTESSATHSMLIIKCMAWPAPARKL